MRICFCYICFLVKPGGGPGLVSSFSAAGAGVNPAPSFVAPSGSEEAKVDDTDMGGPVLGVGQVLRNELPLSVPDSSSAPSVPSVIQPSVGSSEDILSSDGSDQSSINSSVGLSDLLDGSTRPHGSKRYREADDTVAVVENRSVSPLSAAALSQFDPDVDGDFDAGEM